MVWIKTARVSVVFHLAMILIVAVLCLAPVNCNRQVLQKAGWFDSAGGNIGRSRRGIVTLNLTAALVVRK